MLKARFLGIPQISFGTDLACVPLTGRVQALFTYLCVTRQPQSRNKLADLLWDFQSDQAAKSNLRYVLRDLRKEIGDYLIIDGQTIAFNFDLPHWFDVTSFSTYLAPNIQALSAQTEPRILQELLNLYTGDFLAGFYIQDASNFERWMLTQRRHFHDTMVYGLQLATQQHQESGDYEAGLALNQYLLALEPWREEAHRQRMLLLAASGQRSAALMQYELCCQILEEELDVPPMNETTSLYTQIKSGRWFVEQKTVDNFNQQRVAIRAYPQASNTSATTTSPREAPELIARTPQVDLGTMPTTGYLIGRRKELYTLQRWLDSDSCRLAAILGLGGQGKSALAAWFVQEQCARPDHPSEQQLSAQLNSADSQYVKDWPFPSAESQIDALPVKDPVTQIIWRSLAQRPSCIELLQDLTQLLTNKPLRELSSNFDQLVTMLFAALQQRRCLLVLDGAETILTYNTDEEQGEAKAYERLFRLFIERQHRSSLILTSRLRPATLTYMQQQKGLIHCLELDGLTAEDSEEFLEAQGLETDLTNYRRLHQWYAGNPLMLSQSANLIHELFNGDVSAFLQEEIHFLGNIGATLAQQINHLSPLHKQVLHTLAATAQSLSRQALWLQLPSNPPKEAYYDALLELQRAYLIQQANGQFSVTALPAIFLTEHTIRIVE